MRELLVKIKNMITQGASNGDAADDGRVIRGLYSSAGKNGKYAAISGGSIHCPAGDEHLILINSKANEGNKFALPTGIFSGLDPLEPGETAVYNSKTKTEIRLSADGTVVIKNASSVKIEGGDLELDTGNIKLDSGNIELQTGDVTAAGISLKLHKHGGVEQGLSQTTPPV